MLENETQCEKRMEVYFYVPSTCSPFKMEEGPIEAVREFNCIRQVSSRSLKDNKAKENAWKKVATKVRHKL